MTEAPGSLQAAKRKAAKTPSSPFPPAPVFRAQSYWLKPPTVKCVLRFCLYLNEMDPG